MVIEYFVGHWPAILSGIFLLWILYWNRRPKNFPDGPSGIPLLGVIPFLGKRPEKTFMKWSKRYGRVIGLTMGQNLTVVLNTYEALQQALVRQADHFSFRPRDFLFDKIGKRSGISMIDYTEQAKLQRNFILNSLRKFGFARKSMESSIVDEARFLIDAIRECNGEFAKSDEGIMNAVANVICQLTFGRRFEYNDDKGFLYVTRMLTRMNAEECLTIQVVMMLPFMRFFPPISGGIKRMDKTYDKIYEFIQNIIEEHKKTIDYSFSRDFTDDYLAEIRKHVDEKGSIYKERMLLGVIRDFFVAGTETTYTTFRWLFLVLANRPELQEMVHKEITDAVGQDGRLTMAHRDKMSCTQAVIQEVLRYRPAVPMSLPHTVAENTKLYGRDIPKGTTVIPNLFAVNHDPNVWEQPEEFMFRRHLDSDGNFVSLPVASFSIGPRACIGAQLVKMEIFLIASTILQVFKVVAADGKPSSEEPVESGLILPPPDVELFTFVER